MAEPRFTGVEPGRPTDVWLPYAMYNPRAFGNSGFGWFRVFGRLKDERPARAGAERAAGGVHELPPRRAPQRFGPNASPESVARFVNTPLYVRSAANGPSPLRQQFERPLWILAAIAALVLLIAGSNVANLFLARTAAREHEMALRLSIGAGRGRLIQQMLVESALVAGAACAARPAVCRASPRRRSSACSRRPTIRCISIFASTGASPRSPARLTLLTHGAVRARAGAARVAASRR